MHRTIILGLGVLACGGEGAPEAGEPVTPPAAGTPAAPTSPVLTDGSTWRLTGVESLAEMPDSARASLSFETSDHAAGHTGCNRLSGSYAQLGDSLTFGPLVTTRMACQEPAMQVESAFLAALEATRSFVRQGAELRLLGADGQVLARLTHADSIPSR